MLNGLFTKNAKNLLIEMERAYFFEESFIKIVKQVHKGHQTVSNCG